MKKLIIVFTIVLFLPFIELYADSALFLNSTPGRAVIIIDGLVFTQKTPALLRNLSTGTHQIELLKTGYTTIKINTDIKDNDVKILAPTLEYKFIPMIFPTYDDIRINEQPNNRNMLLLEDGTYNFTMNPKQLRITPIYPGQRVINGLNISIPLLAVFFRPPNFVPTPTRKQIAKNKA